MFARARPRLAAGIAFVGGLVLGLGFAVPLRDPLDVVPAYGVVVVAAGTLALAYAWAWPRRADHERYIREAKERLMRERARTSGEVGHKEPEKPGRAHAASPRLVQASQAPSASPELDRVRAQLREVQRKMQEAAVRLGLKQISKEGYTALVQDLQAERSRLETRLIESERRATGRS